MPKKLLTAKDNPKPFTKGGINGATFATWNEDNVSAITEELYNWLLEVDERGNDKGNVFYMDFLYKKGLSPAWVSYVKKRFPTVAKQFEVLEKVKEERLVKMAATGVIKEGITKFVLQNQFNWREKSESKTENVTQITWNEEKTYETNEKANESN